MDLSLLSNIGFTDGEIKVYWACLELEKSTVFGIIKKSGISTSKVYLILDRLIQRGVISFVIEEKQRFYQASNPYTVINFAEKKKDEISDFENKFNKLIPEISAKIGSYKEETARVYLGYRGVRAGFENVLNEFEKGEEYHFMTVGSGEMAEKNVRNFFANYHVKRRQKDVKIKGIIDTPMKGKYDFNKMIGKGSKLRYYNLVMPQGTVIGKTRVLLYNFINGAICFELISSRIADNYRNFFWKFWKLSDK